MTTESPMNINHPHIIQGGMGIAVSDWRLARAVSQAGQLGVVSGTAINSVMIRRLQMGDQGGHTRRALTHFVSQYPGVESSSLVEKILEMYFVEGGLAKEVSFKRSPMFQIKSSDFLLKLNTLATYVEVYLAKEGHDGVVGINLLEKIQLPNLSCLYGALLAGVDYVIMGAGIPREIPGALDLLSKHQVATLKISVAGSNQEHLTTYDPQQLFPQAASHNLRRPYFFPIVSSAVLAATLKKKSTGVVDGFIVETPKAGGHNAPPRGPMQLNALGEPIYGVRDHVEMSDMKALELPFWMAGSWGTNALVEEALQAGAHGVQVGTLFAFCEESGLSAENRNFILKQIRENNDPENGWIFTDPNSSPTGFPFKAVRMQGSVSETAVYEKRQRICDLGYLRHAYMGENGQVGYRCPAEPVADFQKKSGKVEDTLGKKCLCNALMSNIGMAQRFSSAEVIARCGSVEELPLLTAGDDLNELKRILGTRDHYQAIDVINYLLTPPMATATADKGSSGQLCLG